ncbi:hypothetical protein [Nonomuraea longicatena]|uniref:Beta-ketoacyl synthase N-terminal domain-containing protein n=1 Tax=Nonomuraea longicatena TaxID=83682 RepID=A0ABN1Q2V8_9ACTN
MRFSLDAVELVTLPDTGEVDPEALPADLWEVIGTGGDRFRDWFSRLCLYLALRGADADHPRTDDTVVIGTEYGNAAAVADLQRAAAEQGRRLSAQFFPNAHSCAASAYVNLSTGATGRSITLNAGPLTPVLALWHALSSFTRTPARTGHVLIGEVYSPESRLDARHHDSALTCRSGVAYARVRADGDLTAAFDFAPGDGTAPATERNGAFATADYLRRVRSLSPGEHVVLHCGGSGGRTARLTVSRKRGTHG